MKQTIRYYIQLLATLDGATPEQSKKFTDSAQVEALRFMRAQAQGKVTDAMIEQALLFTNFVQAEALKAGVPIEQALLFKELTQLEALEALIRANRGVFEAVMVEQALQVMSEEGEAEAGVPPVPAAAAAASQASSLSHNETDPNAALTEVELPSPEFFGAGADLGSH